MGILAARMLAGDARAVLAQLPAASVALVVTSPPYPMIAMWDDAFRALDPAIPAPETWRADTAFAVFEQMHAVLDAVWAQLPRLMLPGGIAAVNMGDATRTVGKRFARFPNAARATRGMLAAGFTPLPSVLWKKPSNRPNAFLGSGFRPVNVYVTTDCEDILLFRLGDNRRFAPHDAAREASVLTKEQRDAWCTQVWTGVTGVRQGRGDGRRSAAFPLEIPDRLVRLFSVVGDTVLDPFAGTGTTLVAARAAGRVGVGVECDAALLADANARLAGEAGEPKKSKRVRNESKN
jgi:DNA modification methylase